MALGRLRVGGLAARRDLAKDTKSQGFLGRFSRANDLERLRAEPARLVHATAEEPRSAQQCSLKLTGPDPGAAAHEDSLGRSAGQRVGGPKRIAQTDDIP